MEPNLVSPQRLVAKLSDPALTAALSRFVGRRVPVPAAVEDIVQSALTEALDADQAPEVEEEIVRWVHGICRHKMVDWFRRSRREVPRDLESPEDGPVAAAEGAPQSAIDLLRWAEKELPAGEENAKTLEWMLREGAGEKLESIAAEANVPAPRVRQRVSRLRRYYKARWAAQAAALAALVLIALAIALALRQKENQVAPAPGPTFLPSLVPVPPPTAPELAPEPRPASSSQPPESSAPVPESSRSPWADKPPLQAPRTPSPASTMPTTKPVSKAARGSSLFFPSDSDPMPPPPPAASTLPVPQMVQPAPAASAPGGARMK